MNQIAQIRVDYVNQRQGRKPANIRGSDGQYYTIDDAAIAFFQQGAEGTLQYYTNQSGFNIATHWNGQHLPRRAPGAPQPAQGFQQAGAFAPPLPQARGPNPPPQGFDKDDLITRVAIAKSCIEAKESIDTAETWWKWVHDNAKPHKPVTSIQSAPFDDDIPFGDEGYGDIVT